ncbi:uncharacterized protein [Amphiura filiformis]|uniref:uncharacterized protein n=1 Tax=Amphiura filiformis TaxID=82378 RepID=UPI003B21C29D
MDSCSTIRVMIILAAITKIGETVTDLPLGYLPPSLSPSGLNVCGSCLGTDTVYSCCRGWEKEENDGSNCLKPVCSRPCAKGSCTSPNVCTCEVGFVGDVCDQGSTRQYDVRLLHGTTRNQGIVQVRLQTGIWSFVNSKYWIPNNSHVVCRQLGAPGYSFASKQSQGHARLGANKRR